MMNTAASILFRRSLRQAAASRSLFSMAGPATVAARGGGSWLFPARSTAGDHSPSVRFFSASADALVDILKREADEEKENNTLDMSGDLKKLKKRVEADWKVVDDGAMTKLHKTVGALKIQISFHCQDTVEEEYTGASYEEQDEAEEAEPDEMDEPPIGVRFTITSTKAGKSVVWNCVTSNAQRARATIQGVGLTSEDVDLVQKTSGISENLYQGPNFSELAEDLQEAFHEYLEEELGVGVDLCQFIDQYTEYKEQCQYVQFLSDVQTIVKA